MSESHQRKKILGLVAVVVVVVVGLSGEKA